MEETSLFEGGLLIFLMELLTHIGFYRHFKSYFKQN